MFSADGDGDVGQRFTRVAVKMLKANPNSDERLDLLSEFALLKEVENTNVIKLIGACTTDDGPLCIIMDYARYLGS